MNEDKRELEENELAGISGGWTGDDVNQLYQAQGKIPEAKCPDCAQIGTGWQCYPDMYNGSPGMVCICCNCEKHFIVLSDASTYLV